MSETITKAELARTLKLSRARISQLCRDGMPVRSDGKLDRETALKWIRMYHEGRARRGGWEGGMRELRARKRVPVAQVVDTGTRSRTEPVSIEARAYRKVLDRLCLESPRIVDIAVQAGLQDLNVAAALPEMFVAIVFLLVGQDVEDARFGGAYDWAAGDGHAQPNETDYQGLAKRHGLPKTTVRRVLALLEKFDRVIDSAQSTAPADYPAEPGRRSE